MLSTLCALVGLVLITLATAGLAGAWWACLVAGVLLVAVAYGLHRAGAVAAPAAATPLKRAA